ncbi:Putative preQ0 transporter YhhQ [hydrothermal vent metagenome]|uniref:PreQ0 transporter YhhQ n=1 Tax=hydrothermal vent metagenome TaxID=652676 RepID=A0A3B0U908_9ZZZZ
MLTRYLPFITAMVFVVVASNYLVQFPVNFTIGAFNLADLLTWGAFTYPIAFLISDLTNRKFGMGGARIVVMAGFIIAVALSVVLATPRIAIASGAAFFVAQMLDVKIFDHLRASQWWQAPLISSVLASVVDTALFFSLAFAAYFVALGPIDEYAVEGSKLFGVFGIEAPRWVSWALGDLGVKFLVALAMLVPYAILRKKFAQPA